MFEEWADMADNAVILLTSITNQVMLINVKIAPPRQSFKGKKYYLTSHLN